MKSFYKNAVLLVAHLALSLNAISALASGSSGTPSSGNDIFAGLTGNSSQTPYEILESLYNSGRPTKIAEFPSLEECQKNPSSFRMMKSLSNGVFLMTKKEELSVQDGFIIVVHNIHIQAGEIQSPKSDGPLFPISPAIPENDITVPNFLARSPEEFSGTCPSQVDENTKTMMVQGYSFSDTPDGAVQISTPNTENNEAWETETFHSIDGVIVEKAVMKHKNANGGIDTNIGYDYFWQ